MTDTVHITGDHIALIKPVSMKDSGFQTARTVTNRLSIVQKADSADPADEGYRCDRIDSDALHATIQDIYLGKTNKRKCVTIKVSKEGRLSAVSKSTWDLSSLFSVVSFRVY